ncbi:Small-conductance mechanosensitive channel [hydrothermal vent metagenome]|uniref:Small-conductance mechanosensitive channel n=1 Tax=hydrothermal vent metagenome TaxID=652676 RepID=A0A3B1CXH0_9ZZZZ
MDESIVIVRDYATTYGVNILVAIIILIVGFWISKMITKSATKVMTKREMDTTLVKFLSGIIKTLLYVFVIIAAIDKAGIESTSLVAILGAAGLAVGLALQGSLSNFASGVMLIIFKPIKVGDFVEAAGVMGVVQEVGIFVTTLTSPDNKVIFVPNSQMGGGIITNYSVKDTRRVDMEFGIGYTDDIDKARNVILEVLSNDSRILKDPAPDVFVGTLGDSSVNFKVRPWVKGADYWGVYFDVTENIKKKFDENKISIPFPQTDVHLFQESNN